MMQQLKTSLPQYANSIKEVYNQIRIACTDFFRRAMRLFHYFFPSPLRKIDLVTPFRIETTDQKIYLVCIPERFEKYDAGITVMYTQLIDSEMEQNGRDQIVFVQETSYDCTNPYLRSFECQIKHAFESQHHRQAYDAMRYLQSEHVFLKFQTAQSYFVNMISLWSIISYYATATVSAMEGMRDIVRNNASFVGHLLFNFTLTMISQIPSNHQIAFRNTEAFLKSYAPVFILNTWRYIMRKVAQLPSIIPGSPHGSAEWFVFFQALAQRAFIFMRDVSTNSYHKEFQNFFGFLALRFPRLTGFSLAVVYLAGSFIAAQMLLITLSFMPSALAAGLQYVGIGFFAFVTAQLLHRNISIMRSRHVSMLSSLQSILYKNDSQHDGSQIDILNKEEKNITDALEDGLREEQLNFLLRGDSNIKFESFKKDYPLTHRFFYEIDSTAFLDSLYMQSSRYLCTLLDMTGIEFFKKYSFKIKIDQERIQKRFLIDKNYLCGMSAPSLADTSLRDRSISRKPISQMVLFTTPSHYSRTVSLLKRVGAKRFNNRHS